MIHINIIYAFISLHDLALIAIRCTLSLRARARRLQSQAAKSSYVRAFTLLSSIYGESRAHTEKLSRGFEARRLQDAISGHAACLPTWFSLFVPAPFAYRLR